MGIKVGFIGTGEIARVHAEAIIRLNGELEIAGGYDVIDESSKNFCNTYGGKVYFDAMSLINDQEIDAIYICTRHDSHVVLACAACDAGKDVFLEKPLAMNSAEAKILYQKYKQSSVSMAVGFNMRVSPSTLRFKDLLKKYKVQPETFRASMTAAPFMKGWPSDPKMGGGVLVCMGSHMFDLIAHLLESTIEKLCVAVQHIGQPDTLEPNSATILVKLKNGIYGTLLLHDRGCKEFHVEPGSSMVNMTIYSQQGTFDMDAYGKIRYATPEGLREELVHGGNDQCYRWGYFREAKEFMRLLEGKKTNLCSIEQAMEVVAVVDAARESSLKNSWIEIK